MSAQLPRVDVVFEDGGLGLVTPSGANLQLKVGTASKGTLGIATSVARLAQVNDAFGPGQLSSALAVALIESKPVLGLRVPSSVAGTVTPVTFAGTGTAVGSVTGDPYDAVAVTATVTRDAAALSSATGAVRLSIDGTDLGERAVPVNGVVSIPGTGLSLILAAGSLVKGDSFSFTATAPGTTLADIAAAIEGYVLTRKPVRFIHVLGVATPALGAAVDAILASAASRGYYTHAVLDARLRNAGETVAEYDAAIDAAWSNFASDRVSVSKEGGVIYNPLTARSEIRPASWPVTMRRTTVPVGQDASRVKTGYLRGVSEVTVDAAQNSGVSRFITLMTIDGHQGAYTAAWPIMSPDGSDYDLVQSREVIDEAARASRTGAISYMGDNVRVDPISGRIREEDALTIEAYIAGVVRAQLGSNISSVRIVIDREINIISTRRMEFDCLVTPLGYLREIGVRVGYVNPFLGAIQSATPSAETAGNPAGGNA